MSVSLLSLKSEESKAITNGQYRCKLDGSNLVITDGVNTWTIGQSEFIDLEQRLTAIINSKADVVHAHSISDVTDYEQPDLTPYAQLAANNTFTGTNTFNNAISAPNITTITNTLATKADATHTHEFADIYKNITVEGTTTTKTLQHRLHLIIP